MASKSNILNENRPDFICSANGDIVIHKVEHPKNSSNIQKEENGDKSGEPYLFKKWHPSNQKGYVSYEFRNTRFSG